MEDGIFLALENMVKATNTEKTGSSLEFQYRRTLVELFREELMQFSAEYLQKCVLLEGKHLYDRDIRMKFLKLEFVRGETLHYFE